MAEAVLCADIGGSFIRLGCWQGQQFNELAKRPTPADDWPKFVDTLQAMLSDFPPSWPLAVSTAGVVDSESDCILAANIPAFSGHLWCQELCEQLARRVVAANDADCFALAQARWGAAKGCKNIFALILGSGVGGAQVVNGQLIRGAGGISGEWGHGPVCARQVVSPDGRDLVDIPRFACGCGQYGCLDSVGGARGLERLDQHFHQLGRSSQSIIALWHQSEPRATWTVTIYLQLLSEPLAMIANLTGAERMPVGGGLASEPALIAALDRQVRPLTLRQADQPLLVVGHHLAQASLMGAAALIAS